VADFKAIPAQTGLPSWSITFFDAFAIPRASLWRGDCHCESTYFGKYTQNFTFLGDKQMRENFLKWTVKGKMLVERLKEENGQDLVEYAAVISLVVLALVGGMGTLANGINSAMTAVSTRINGAIG
jgi:Flp pilus assembly pilin Flp